MNTTTVIQAENLTQVFRVPGGTLTAVDNLDLTISKGEIIALLGPNGAGKTTLIDMILGLTEPARGTLTVQGISPKKAVQRGDIGAVLQTGGLLKDLTVRQTLEMLATLYPARIDIDKVLANADLTELAHRKVGKCSGGQQQRIRFAIATMHDPNILILDEPTTGMDVTARRTFWERMDKLAETGKTIIFATHYLEEAQNFAQRIVLMNNGKIIADGTSEEIRDLTGGRHVSFLADKPITFSEYPMLSVETSEENGAYRHRTTVANADEFARVLLTKYTVRDLEIVKPSLDESFVQLTDRAAQEA
ncbi:ABC transporter ATP-binding protein [Rothia dentocariosa]|uniref:ABC transporter ATP-binding protein n=1 Tax=Rothia dentocariosa TaxID=2047 RepID=UPI0039A278E5